MIVYWCRQTDAHALVHLNIHTLSPKSVFILLWTLFRGCSKWFHNIDSAYSIYELMMSIILKFLVLYVDLVNLMQLLAFG